MKRRQHDYHIIKSRYTVCYKTIVRAVQMFYFSYFMTIFRALQLEFKAIALFILFFYFDAGDLKLTDD